MHVIIMSVAPLTDIIEFSTSFVIISLTDIIEFSISFVNPI